MPDERGSRSCGVSDIPKTIKGYQWFEQVGGRLVDSVSLLGNGRGGTRYASIVVCKSRDDAKDFARKVKAAEAGPRAKVLNGDKDVEAFKQEMAKSKGWSSDAPDGDKAITAKTGADIRGDASGFSHGFNPYARGTRSRSRSRGNPGSRSRYSRSRSRSRSPAKRRSSPPRQRSPPPRHSSPRRGSSQCRARSASRRRRKSPSVLSASPPKRRSKSRRRSASGKRRSRSVGTRRKGVPSKSVSPRTCALTRHRRVAGMSGSITGRSVCRRMSVDQLIKYSKDANVPLHTLVRNAWSMWEDQTWEDVQGFFGLAGHLSDEELPPFAKDKLRKVVASGKPMIFDSLTHHPPFGVVEAASPSIVSSHTISAACAGAHL